MQSARQRSKQLYFIVALILSALAVMTLVTLGILLTGTMTDIIHHPIYIFIFISFGLNIGVLWYGLAILKADILEIIYPLTIFSILNYPLRALFVLQMPYLANLPRYWPGETAMTYALLLTIIGEVVFFIGYFINRRGLPMNWLPDLNFNWKPGGSFFIRVLSLYAIGMVAYLVLLSMGKGLRFQWESGTGAFDYILIMLGDLRTWAIFLLWSIIDRQKIFGKLFIIALTGFEIFLALVNGSKTDAFLILVAIIFVQKYVFNKNIGRFVVFATVFFIFIFTPGNQIYRKAYQNTLGYLPAPKIEDMLLVVQDLPHAIQTGNTGFTDALVYVGNRMLNLDTVTILVDLVPDRLPYQKGATLLNGVVGLIPRFLWPDKPVINLGEVVTSVIFGSSSITNTPLTDVGEFYWNYGFWGVVIGMFFLGAVFRSLYQYGARTPSPQIRGLVLFVFFPVLLFLQTGVTVLIVSLSRIIPLLFVVGWYMDLKLSYIPKVVARQKMVRLRAHRYNHHDDSPPESSGLDMTETQ